MSARRPTWRRPFAALVATLLLAGCAATPASSPVSPPSATIIPSAAFPGPTFEPAVWTACSPSGFGAIAEMPGPCVKATTGLAAMLDKSRVLDGYSFHLGAPSMVTLDLPYDFSVLELDNAAAKGIDPERFRDAVVKAVYGGSLGRDLVIDGISAPGREFVVKIDTAGVPAGHGLMVRMIPDGDVMWVLTVMLPLTHLDSPDVLHFVDSFKVVP